MAVGRDWEITFGGEGPHIRVFEYDPWARRRSAIMFTALGLLGRPQDGRFLGRSDRVCALANRLSIWAINHEYESYRIVLDLLIADEDAANADPVATSLWTILQDSRLSPEEENNA